MSEESESYDRGMTELEQQRDETIVKLRKIYGLLNHQTFSCANGEFNANCPKCIASELIVDLGG